jgi:hypothetical protein
MAVRVVELWGCGRGFPSFPAEVGTLAARPIILHRIKSKLQLHHDSEGKLSSSHTRRDRQPTPPVHLSLNPLSTLWALIVALPTTNPLYPSLRTQSLSSYVSTPPTCSHAVSVPACAALFPHNSPSPSVRALSRLLRQHKAPPEPQRSPTSGPMVLQLSARSRRNSVRV